MSAHTVVVAQEVATILAGASLSMPFTATYYKNIHELPDLVETMVVVQPGTFTDQIVSRNSVQRDVEVVVTIDRHIEGNVSLIDDLQLLTEEIHDLLRTTTLSTISAAWASADNQLVLDRLEDKQLYTHISRITYRTFV